MCGRYSWTGGTVAVVTIKLNQNFLVYRQDRNILSVSLNIRRDVAESIYGDGCRNRRFAEVKVKKEAYGMAGKRNPERFF